MKKFIGLIGLGYWGKNHLRNLNELDVLHTACDVNKSILKQFSSTYNNVNFTDSIIDILNNPEIKAIIISTPAATHYEIAKKALLSKKDVLVEKPLALTVKEGEELINIAEKESRVLMVGHILHYHPAVKKLKELIFTGQLGKIQYIYSNRLNIGKLRVEENILWSFAPHDISLILSIVGEQPVKVLAAGGAYLNEGIFDTTITTLEFKNNVRAHIFVSWLHPYKEQKLVIVGSKAMAVFDDVSKEKLFIYPHKIEWKNGKIPIAQKSDFHIVPIDNGEPLKLELQHFIECVLERKKPITDGQEGLSVLKILDIAETFIAKKTEVQGQTTLPSKIYVHESSYVDNNVTIGKGTKIWHYSHILSGSTIGSDCIIGQNVMIGPDVKIGNRCKIQNNVSIYKGVTLEDGVFCGPSCVFTNVYNPR
ncbi:MAG TPA: oxidoreductase, partial [Nitrospirae bacterium]|nr:oxidoreductase [Nitrospirota bacterium]